MLHAHSYLITHVIYKLAFEANTLFYILAKGKKDTDNPYCDKIITLGFFEAWRLTYL